MRAGLERVARWWPVVLVLALLLAGWMGRRSRAEAPARGDQAYLPYVGRARPAATATPTRTPTVAPSATSSPTPDVCQSIPGQSYGTLRIEGQPSDRPAEQHADLNLALRGYAPADSSATNAIADNCDTGPDDTKAPQLRGLFADRRRPTFAGVYRVWQWDWASNRRGSQLEPGLAPCGNGRVSLAMVRTTPGEVLYVPDSGYSIDNPGRYEVLVSYASEERITLKYTREDNVLVGYTLHLENICVEPSLLALYRQMNALGRRNLPALHDRQPFARARGSTVGLVIRDSGQWLDPRCCNDWWRLP